VTTRKSRTATDIQRMAPGYGRLLATAMKAGGLTKDDLAEPGLKGSQIWRLTNPEGKGERPPVAAAERLRLAIQRRRPDIQLPPPAVLVDGAEHYEWIELGTRLMSLDYDRFSEHLAALRKLVEGLEGVERLVNPGGGDE
jgi:hypothetical protein